MANKVVYYDPLKFGKPQPIKVAREDHVEYDVRDKFIRIGEGDQDMRVEKEVYETTRVDRDQYIQSFAKDVGLDNLVKKVLLTGDSSILEQSKGITGDFVGFPRTNMEMQDMIDSAKVKAKKLGTTLDTKALDAYVEKRFQELMLEEAKKQVAAQKAAEGENK